MPKANVGWVSKSLAVLAKDIQLEMRSRYALSTILLFGIAALTVVSFSLGQTELSARTLSALYWIVMFFAAMSGLSQVFVREESGGTSLGLRLHGDPDAILTGKLLFNLGLLVLMTVIITPLYLIFTHAPVGNWLPLVLVLILGVLGLCAATTLIAAIISKASIKGALFAVMSLPVLMPLLLVLVKATASVFNGAGFATIGTELQFLFAYSVVMITGSVMLFKFVWQE